MKHPEIIFEDYNVTVKEMNLVLGRDNGSEVSEVRYFGAFHTRSVGSERILSHTDDVEHILEPANPPRNNRLVLDVSNKPNKIVLCEDTSTSDNVLKSAYSFKLKTITNNIFFRCFGNLFHISEQVL